MSLSVYFGNFFLSFTMLILLLIFFPRSSFLLPPFFVSIASFSPYFLLRLAFLLFISAPLPMSISVGASRIFITFDIEEFYMEICASVAVKFGHTRTHPIFGHISRPSVTRRGSLAFRCTDCEPSCPCCGAQLKLDRPLSSTRCFVLVLWQLGHSRTLRIVDLLLDCKKPFHSCQCCVWNSEKLAFRNLNIGENCAVSFRFRPSFLIMYSFLFLLCFSVSPSVFVCVGTHSDAVHLHHRNTTLALRCKWINMSANNECLVECLCRGSINSRDWRAQDRVQAMFV